MSLVDPTGLFLFSPGEGVSTAGRLTVQQLANPRTRTPAGAIFTAGFAVGAFGAGILHDLKNNDDNCDDDGDDDCIQLNQEIRKLRDELSRRFPELREDRLGLPETGRFSRQGHRIQIRNKQIRLRKYLEKAQVKGCAIWTPDAWKWATQHV